jgi:hypothetical protein
MKFYEHSRLLIASAFSGALVLGAAGFAAAATGANPVSKLQAEMRANLDDNSTTSVTVDESTTTTIADTTTSDETTTTLGDTTSSVEVDDTEVNDDDATEVEDTEVDDTEVDDDDATEVDDDESNDNGGPGSISCGHDDGVHSGHYNGGDDGDDD